MLPVFIGIAGIAVTVALHAFSTSLLLIGLKWYAQVRPQWQSLTLVRPLVVGATAVFLASKHYLDIALYAFGYWFFENASQLDDYESALYFSSVTYTTLGYGDIVLTDGWRLLCGLQAMNGTLLFGWSTALLFLLVQRLWFSNLTPGAGGEFKKYLNQLHNP